MKKATIVLVLMLAVAGIARSQIIEDFEHIELNVFAAGAEGYMHVVPNPAPDEVNMSTHVVEFRRGADGDPWAGFWSRLPEPLDLSVNKYVYVDVWKPIISPVVFKMEPDDADDVETESMFPQTEVEVWETLVFDFSDMDGLVEVISFFPDFPETLELEEDIFIYFDNIRVSGPPEGKDAKDGFDDVDFVWCDFEDPEFTNVDGFHNPINAGTTDTDVPGAGVSGGAAKHLAYIVEEEFPITGYFMWAWDPDWVFDDLSEYTHLVIHARAEGAPVSNIRVELFDHNEYDGDGEPGAGYGLFDLGTAWEEIKIPLEDLELIDDIENHPDMTQLQLIALVFDYEVTSPHEGEIYVDVVGFSAVEDDGNGNDLNGYMVENFEHIPLNVMLGGAEDDSRMYVVPNPDMNDANPSTHVVKFERSQHGVPWGGFWSPLPEPLDLSENKYVYVDVWKPRISMIRFKVEAGETPDLEIESMEPQTKVEEWETMVFDFSEKDGLWNIIAFMPDFVEPVGLEEDIVIYFDNIRLGGPPDEVSIQDVVAEGFDVRVFPNPAHGTVNVEAPEGASVSLIDVTGSMVDHRRQAGDGSVRFDLSGLPQGIYLIRVVHEEANVTKRLFVY